MIQTQPEQFRLTISPHEFGERLKSLLYRYAISFHLLATQLGTIPNTSKASLSRLCNGKVTEKTLLKVINPLRSTLSTLLSEGGVTDPQVAQEIQYLFPEENQQNMIANRCQLTSRAVKHFNLTQDPFDVDRVPTDDEIFTSDELDDVAARVRDAVVYKRFVAVIGGVGSGKTSLKIRIARELEDSNKKKRKTRLLYPEFFDMNTVSVSSIARYILDEFEVPCPRDTTARVRKIKEQLTSLHNEDVSVAIVFDECHWLNDKVLRSLKNFWEMTNGGFARLLGVVLFGQPRFVESTLRDFRFKEVAERVQVVQMPSMEKSAADYLAHKLAASGGNINQLFDERAIERICRVAKTPLALGNLANESLMRAFALEEKQVASAMLNLPDAPQLRSLRRAS